jgi:hypothetical protein
VSDLRVEAIEAACLLPHRHLLLGCIPFDLPNREIHPYSSSCTVSYLLANSTDERKVP